MNKTKSNSIEDFRHRLMTYTQDKAFGKRLWHNSFSTQGRTVYWNSVFNHCVGGFSGVLKI